MLLRPEQLQSTFYDDQALYWTDDCAELPAICRFRQQIFKDYWNLNDFPAEPDMFDLTGQLLVWRKRGRIVGGARINIVMSGTSAQLPCESDKFRIDRKVPSLYSPGTLRAEMSRLFIDSEAVDARQTHLMDQRCLELVEQWRARQLVFVAPKRTAIRNRRTGKRLGWKVVIHDGVKLTDKPDYNGIEMVFCSASKLLPAELTLH